MEMLCKKSIKKSGDGGGSVPVYLNVYDMTSINGYAYWLGLGVYHSGVQVHGVEYAFGGHEFSTTGIFEGVPKQCDGFIFRKMILIGKTDLNSTEVRAVMEDLAEIYKGNAYNLITKNCNHFCNDACIKLTGNSIPSWVNRLARIGFLCNCVLPVTLNSTRIGRHRIEDKMVTVEETEELTSETTKTPSSNSSLSVTSSPCSTLRGERSRTRRAPPPSSPLISRSLSM